MAKKAKKKAPGPVIATSKIVLESQGDPVYANFAEVSAALHEFQISFALAPTRPTPELVEQAKTGTLRLETIVQVLLPPTMIPGLIKALLTTKEHHEAIAGPIKEVGSSNG